MSEDIKELLEVLERDNLVSLRKILDRGDIDFNSNVFIGQEYDLDEPEEVPLLFYLIMKDVSLEAFKLLLEYGLDLNFTNKEGLGALDIAIKSHRMDIVALCKERGISLNKSRRKSGMTPLMLASAFNDVEMVEYLIKEGVDIDCIDRYGMNALDYAKKMGQNRVKEILESKSK